MKSKEMPIMNSEEIKALRTALGLKQAEMAELAKVSVDAIKSWESGRREPDKRANDKLWRIVEMDEALESIMKNEVKKVEDAKSVTLTIVQKAEQTYLAQCDELGFNPNVGITKGAMRSPFKPAWLLNSPIEYERKGESWARM